MMLVSAVSSVHPHGADYLSGFTDVAMPLVFAVGNGPTFPTGCVNVQHPFGEPTVNLNVQKKLQLGFGHDRAG